MGEEALAEVLSLQGVVGYTVLIWPDTSEYACPRRPTFRFTTGLGRKAVRAAGRKAVKRRRISGLKGVRPTAVDSEDQHLFSQNNVRTIKGEQRLLPPRFCKLGRLTL